MMRTAWQSMHAMKSARQRELATLIVKDAEINTDEITGSDASGKGELEALGIVYR